MKALINLICPQCNATLSVEEDREMLFCSYCGHKILLNDENKHTYRYINDAEIKRAETERIIKLKEMEIEEKKRANKKIAVIIWLVMTMCLGVPSVLGVVAGENDWPYLLFLITVCVGGWGAAALFTDVFKVDKRKKTQIAIRNNEVLITSKMSSFDEKHYQTVFGFYKGAGFENISTVPLHDLGMFATRKVGLVESVTINGEDDFDEGEVFDKSAQVVITYHSVR